jgi:hypothetical protein
LQLQLILLFITKTSIQEIKMKALTMTEIEQVNGAGLIDLANVCAGSLVGAAAMTQLGAVNIGLTGVVVAAPYLAIAGAVLGATFGYAISQSAQPQTYYYY